MVSVRNAIKPSVDERLLEYQYTRRPPSTRHQSPAPLADNLTVCVSHCDANEEHRSASLDFTPPNTQKTFSSSQPGWILNMKEFQ